MSTHKHFDGICCVVLVLTLVLTAILANGESLGIQKASTVMGYEKTLFDPSKVHTIDIRMDDWDTFLDNCTSEEYYDCTVVIDNEAYKNVAIRGKGNISLTQVQAYGNDRYSFKIEFDHYDKSNTYYGLDKLCLNNLIQDNTCMKDYLTYQMMGKMGVASPLCSYVYITVNGEDWGLYLAVEGVEESFLRRNYGKDYGELYKPDSMSMGGGRGNGGGFDMNEFFGKSDSETADETDQTAEGLDKAKKDFPQEFSQMPEGMSGEIPEGILEEMPDDMPEEMSGEMPEGMPGEMPEGMPGEMPKEIPGEMPEGMPGEMPEGMPGQMPKDMPGEMPEGMPGEMPGGMPGSSEDVLLKYIDEEYDSYSNIFDNAKTDITDADKTRLIEALKNLGDGENLDSTVDTEAVIKYFVVHNFVLNFDSYTGAMIHNYYLYEKDGQMQMIPWDYNLAFGGFQSSGSATSLVNDPIDSPVSGGSVEDRPMIAWIFENQDYTEQYHQYFSEFIEEYFDSGYFEEWIESVISLISPYVEKDPTKFCTYEEFQTGSATLKEFCLLRAESVSGQLEGTIGSTDDTQESDTLIDAGDMQVSDMGAMEHSEKMPHGNSAEP